MPAHLVTEDIAAKALQHVANWPDWTYDLETTGLDPSRKDVAIGVAVEGFDGRGKWDNHSFYFPFRHREGNIDRKHLPSLMQLLSTRRRVRTWNGGFDARFSWNEGARVDIPMQDCMLDHHLLDENKGRGQYNLKGCAEQQFGPGATQAERNLDFLLASMLIPDKGGMWRLHSKNVAPYACGDVQLTRAMDEVQGPKLQHENLENVSSSVGEYARIVAGMEHRGITIDRALIESEIPKVQKRIYDLFVQAMQMAGRKIALNSADAVCAWLGIPSSADEILQRMSNDPRVKIVQEFRKARTAYNNYYKKFLAMAPDDVLRANMMLFIVISGRMSVTDPPLQALPRDTSSYLVKKALIARPGYTLVQADYQRAEMCLAAHYGKDTNMIALLRSGVNMHRAVAEELGIDYDSAKRINFSVIYGIGPETLADRINKPYAVAKMYLDRYHRKFPGFKRLYSAAHDYAEAHKYITMCTGRRRHYNRGDRTPTHKASSNLIQGSVAEIIRESQINIDHELRTQDVHQLLQIHDAVIAEVPTEEVPRLVPRIKEIMEDHTRFAVPMRVDIKYGPNLADTTEWKEAA